MKSWFTYLKQGLSRQTPRDRISVGGGYGSPKDNFKNLIPYFKNHWLLGMRGGVFILAATLFALPPPLITRYLVDDVILGRQVGLLAGAILLLIGCLAAEKFARLLEEFYFARFEQNITLDIQQDLFDRVLHFPKSFFDDKQTGYLQSRLTEDVDSIRWFFSSTIVHVISNGVRFIGGVVFLFYLEWRLAIAVLILLPGLVWVIRFFSGRIYILSHQAMEHKADVSGDLQESLSEVSLIKAHVNEDRTRDHLMSAVRKVFQIGLEQQVMVSLFGISINAMPGAARITTLAVGAFWIINGQWSIGSLLAFQAYMAYVFGPAQILASSNLQYQKALAALERVSAIFGIAPENIRQGGHVAGKLKGDIEFSNISFGYKGYEPILKDISLHIHPGERVALVGVSGIGKTTLLSLILQFYPATDGEIYFDGQPASDYNTRSLRQRIGYASQHPKILTGTVWENLGFGAPDADRNRFIQAAKVAAIHDDIEKLPHKYETIIGAKGLSLSQGQKQRLSIARALIKDPDILLLDEPTSALDSATEKFIFDALPSLVNGKTVIVASHRISTIMQTDRILLFNENGIADIGSPDTLLQSGVDYRPFIADRKAERQADGVAFATLE